VYSGVLLLGEGNTRCILTFYSLVEQIHSVSGHFTLKMYKYTVYLVLLLLGQANTPCIETFSFLIRYTVYRDTDSSPLSHQEN